MKLISRMIRTAGWSALLLLAVPLSLLGQSTRSTPVTRVVELKYVSPLEVQDVLKDKQAFAGGLIPDVSKAGMICNSATNQILLTGDSATVAEVLQVIHFLDVPPRQIIIEAKIVEIDNEKASELGFDWQEILDGSYVDADLWTSFQKKNVDPGMKTEEKMSRGSVGGESRVEIGKLLRIIKDDRIGRVVSVPRIVTTNNKPGTILDGYRITYVTRYSSHSNLFETQEMTAGLSLAVTPSLGQSGYLKLDITAKLTTLGEVISGSPSEVGQIIQNTVIVKDGSEFFLGGFKKTQKVKLKRKVPILGTILPFLFSRTSEVNVDKDFLIALKPTVIDLKTAE